MNYLNAVKQKLAAGQVALGGWNMIGHSIAVEVLGKAGFDWVAMDMEHGVMDFPQLVVHCQVLEGLGVVPFSRLPAIRPEYFKWALDAGARGVIVPWVRNAEDARNAVAYTRYAPEGMRGAALTRVHDFGSAFDTYTHSANEQTMLVLMIEHIDAVNQIDDILSVKGVDAIFIGPYDLAGSMGLMGETRHPRVAEAIQQVLAASRKFHIAAGLHLVDPEPGELARRAAEGFQLIALGLDTTLLNTAARQMLQEQKGALDE